MTMHLLPVYYTTTSTRKRKKSKKSKSLLKAEAEHQKFLKKIRGGSSVGRASGLQPEGHGFDPLPLHQKNATVAQSEEHLICNQRVGSSSLSGGTIKSMGYVIFLRAASALSRQPVDAWCHLACNRLVPDSHV